jgi:hypothetical protein
MKPGKSLQLLVVASLFGSGLLSAQQRPPPPDPGYAVEGRPGFVIKYNPDSSGWWEPFDIEGMPRGMQKKILSKSPSMGALTLLTYIPEGWSHASGYHSVDEEIFVLEGDLRISDYRGEQTLSKYSYTYFPAGMAHGPLTSRQGAVLLQWYKGVPDFVASASHKPGTRLYAQVRNWNHFEQPWYTGGPFPEYRVGGNIPGAIHKLVRQDPDTGEMTWLTFGTSIPAPSRSAGIFGGGYERHDSFEEYYFLEKAADSFIGECLEQGLTQIRYGNRSYWWRPGGVGHGGPTSHGQNRPDYSIALVRTGARLWADYFTDCSYDTQMEYGASGFRTFDAGTRK